MKANKFAYRLSDPYEPIEEEQDRHFPAIEQLSYDKYLVAVNKLFPASQNEYSLTFADGANCGTEGSENNWTCH